MKQMFEVFESDVDDVNCVELVIRKTLAHFK